MKRLLLSTAFAIGLAFPANSQTYPGQFPANTVFGNATGSTAVPVPSSVINAQMANMLADTVKCNPTGLSAAVQDCASPIVTNLTANSNVTTGGTLTFAGGIANTSASTSLLSQLSSVSGSDSTHVAVAYNYLNVSSDSAVLTGGGNGTFGALLYAILNFGNSTSMRGGRTAVQGVLTQQGKTGNNGPLQGFQPFYISGGFSVEGKFNDNGTGVTSTTASGSITGVNGIAVLDGTATNFYNIQGAEFDIAIATGASSYRKEGVLIAQLSNDAVHGTSEGGLVIANQPGALGWNIGIEIGNPVGGALATTGSVLACGGNCGTITNGIDLSAFTISTSAFKSTGFNVDGSGNLTANNITTAWSGYTPATTCGTATFTTNNARSKTLGKTTPFELDVTVSAVGTCASGSSFSFTLPITPQSGGGASGRESARSGALISCAAMASNMICSFVGNNGGTYTPSLNDRWVISGVIENQ